MEIKKICRGESLTGKLCGKEITAWRQTAWDSFIDTVTLAVLFNQGRGQIHEREQCLECRLNDELHIKLLSLGMISGGHCDWCKENAGKGGIVRYPGNLFTTEPETLIIE